MKIYRLLKNVEYLEKNIDDNEEILDISVDSRFCQKESLFFAINGNNKNGNDYILDAINNGAKVIVTSKRPNIDCKYILCKDVRKLESQIAYNFYEINNKIKLIGVVGTNGKTTITYMLKHIFSSCGKNVGVIGTLGIYFNKHKLNPEMTTPDSVFLTRVIKQMIDEGVEYCFLEVSAHAISQKRVDAFHFETLIFTNCSHDHLDYFKTFEEYKKTKASIFSKEKCTRAVVNIDDNLGFEIAKNSGADCFLYGLENPSDVFAVNVKTNKLQTSFMLNLFDYIEKVKINMIGKYNVYNAMASLQTAVLCKLDKEKIINSLSTFSGVSGRMEFIEEYNGAQIFVDYAHTPDGLKNSIITATEIVKRRVIVVFGCGGLRDKEKRSIMGKIAGEYADFTIITSDNPRFEEPYSIIKDIEKGLREKSVSYITIQNRYLATAYAIKMLKKGDVLLVLGKGAEEYQEIMSVKIPYNDKEKIREIIGKLSLGGDVF